MQLLINIHCAKHTRISSIVYYLVVNTHVSVLHASCKALHIFAFNSVPLTNFLSSLTRNLYKYIFDSMNHAGIN